MKGATMNKTEKMDKVIKDLETLAQAQEALIQNANWSNNPGDAAYHAGVRYGYLKAVQFLLHKS
jgi:hypothetical protein